MIKEQAFRALISLVEFDQSIYTLENQIQVVRSSIADIHAQERSLMKDIEQSKQRLLDFRKLVDEKELHMKELDAHERVIKERIDRAHNNKEYVALQAENTQLKLEQHNVEQEVVDAWNKRDAAHAAYDLLRQQSQEQIAVLHQSIAHKEEQAARLTSAHDQLIAQRADKVSVVPGEWLEKYNALGSRIKDPVVAVESGACGGCFNALTNQELMRLQRGALLQCQSCFRFIYAPAAMGVL